MLTLRSPDGKPVEYQIIPGKNVIGRMSDSHIYIEDISASRRHAELSYDPEQDTLILIDLESRNGTFVNHQRINSPVNLHANDSIRIGQCVITVARSYTDVNLETSSRAHRHTRELLLESLDHHAVLMYEVARQLNTVMDIDSALQEVARLMQRAMGADKCEVILADQFDRLRELGFPESIAQTAIEQQSTVIIPDILTAFTEFGIGQSALLMRVKSALCVPVISGDEILALIYMYKTEAGTRSFEQGDIELAVAISHQAALTIQRMRLMDNIRKEQQVHQLLRRFLSPQEAAQVVQDFLERGCLPALEDSKVSVLFADIADSTGLAEHLGAQKFAHILESYYQIATDIVFTHGGIVKLMGDGIMAVFGYGQPEVEHEVQAVKAGLEIINSVHAFFQDKPDMQIVIGIGVNSGIVVAGYVGTNDRVEFAVLGDVVNVAYRMQSFARPNRLIVGPATAAAVVGRFETRRIGGTTVKGRTKPIQLFEVIRSE